MSDRNFTCQDGVCYWTPNTSNINTSNINTSTTTTINTSNTIMTNGLCDTMNAPSHLTQSAFPMPQDQTPWTVYGAEWCPFCLQAKKFLEENFAQFVYHDLEKIPDGKSSHHYLDAMTGGYQKIPMVFYYGQFIGGYTDLVKFFKQSNTSNSTGNNANANANANDNRNDNSDQDTTTSNSLLGRFAGFF